MPGHEMRITVQMGNEVDGWILDHEIVETLWPRATTDQEKIDASRDTIRVGFRDLLHRVVGVAAVDEYVAEHVSELQ